RHTLAIRCRCGHVYSVLLDFRRHFRNPTSLAGTYVSRDPAGPGGGVIRILNISRSGVGFTVSGRHRILPGQELQIEFQLTDRNRTVIKKQAVVRTVQENTVGCEFLCAGELDKALGFFLQG
ncbi:MAG: PilZ domain-containing protein, partial [Desulfobulbus sp.]|nr:PilZ domain-containing protein [Desulfobulbus sp.]